MPVYNDIYAIYMGLPNYWGRKGMKRYDKYEKENCFFAHVPGDTVGIVCLWRIDSTF